MPFSTLSTVHGSANLTEAGLDFNSSECSVAMKDMELAKLAKNIGLNIGLESCYLNQLLGFCTVRRQDPF